MLPKAEFYVQIGAQIRAARTARGIPQKALAHQLEISRTTLANIEGGRQAVQAYVLAQIAEILTTPVVELFPAPPDISGSVPEALRDRPSAETWFRRVVNKEPL